MIATHTPTPAELHQLAHVGTYAATFVAQYVSRRILDAGLRWLLERAGILRPTYRPPSGPAPDRGS